MRGGAAAFSRRIGGRFPPARCIRISGRVSPATPVRRARRQRIRVPGLTRDLLRRGREVPGQARDALARKGYRGARLVVRANGARGALFALLSMTARGAFRSPPAGAPQE